MDRPAADGQGDEGEVVGEAVARRMLTTAQDARQVVWLIDTRVRRRQGQRSTWQPLRQRASVVSVADEATGDLVSGELAQLLKVYHTTATKMAEEEDEEDEEDENLQAS